jgi:hypothetical protein
VTKQFFFHLAGHDEEGVVEVVAGDDGLVEEVHGDGAAAVEQGRGKTFALVGPRNIRSVKVLAKFAAGKTAATV